MSQQDPRLPAILDSAVHQLHTTLAVVADKAIETLQALSTSAHRIAERDDLLDARNALARQLPVFRAAFADGLRARIGEELAPAAEGRRRNAGTDWQSLSLVDDAQIEQDMAISRIAQQISNSCEWELRELGAYMGALLMLGRADESRNPLRASVVAAALWRGVESISRDDVVRKLLVKELAVLVARALPETYETILHDIKGRGIQPAGLSVRGVEGPGNQLSGVITGYDTAPREDWRSTGSPASHFPGSASTGLDTGGLAPRATGSGTQELGATGTLRGPATHGSGYPSGWPASGLVGATGPATGGPASGAAASGPGGFGGGTPRSRAQIDAELMSLLRRINFIGLPNDEAGEVWAAATPADAGSMDGWPSLPTPGVPGQAPVNLIRAHQDELKRASAGALDHLVIEVVGSLFDQILADARVPPQMARQIARLQLPVLKVALSDPSFFSSRKHPVRRFVNRIASLACAYDDFSDGPGRLLLERVRELVQQIVDGDFDQLDLYAGKLAELERFTAQNAEEQVEQQASAATLLERKESELRVQQRFMAQLQGALGPIAIPPYLRDFLTQVWSQSLVTAARRDGPGGERLQRYRTAGRQLVMSVQPKGSTLQRQKFLMQLPGLMKDLREGLDLIGWPVEAQKQFFAQLMPSHAEALKGPPMTELDHNMMVKQVDAIFAAPVPRAEDTHAGDVLPVLTDEVVTPRFTEAEAEQVGLVREQQVDWDGSVDIDLADLEEQVAEASAPPVGALKLDINLDAIDAEPAEPSRGPSLIDHLKIGFAYQMHLKDRWQKVRLSFISPGRAFFVFTHGKKHQETLSMTSRMLQRVCDSGRLKAYESSYLIERATHRARRQLAAIKSGSDAPASVH